MVEAGEYLGPVDISESRTLIADAHPYIAVFLKGCSDVDAAAFCAVLYSIHQDIHQNCLAFPEVEFHFFHVGVWVDVYRDSFSVLFLDDVINGALEPLVEVSLLYSQSALSFFELPQVEDHVQKDLHTFGLSVDTLQCRCLRLVRIGFAQQPFQRSHDQCQRRSQLMADVYEHTHLFFIYCLLLFLQCQLETACLSEHQTYDYA